MPDLAEEKESNQEQENAVPASTVEEQYELFNRELGLDDSKDNKSSEETGAETEKTADASEATAEATTEATTEESEEKTETVEEPDSDDEDLGEDLDEWDGDDPNEAEVEVFCQPPEQSVITDLTDQTRKRRVIVYPIKVGELGHPSMIEVMKNCLEFKTTFLHSKLNGVNEKFSFHGIVELSLKTTIAAVEALEALKSIREDITVKVMEPGETAKKLMQNWTTDTAVNPSTVIQNLLVVKPVTDSVTVDQLRDMFPGSSDIVIARPKFFPRLAYVSYEDNSGLDEIVNKYTAEKPVLGDRRVKVMKYQPPNLPAGFLKLKRRYRILLQIKKLKKALNATKAKYSENQRMKMKSTIEHCTSLIEKDDAVRTEIGLKMFTLQELRRIRKIRESVKMDTIWLPRLPGDSRRGDHGKIDLGDDDDNKESSQERRGPPKGFGRRNDRREYRSSPPRGKRLDSRGGNSGVPSLMSMQMEPIAHVQALTQQLAKVASMIGPAMGGMRGGFGRGGGRNRGRFGSGRSGFMDEDMSPDFGPPGGLFGPRRSGGFGSGGGGGGSGKRQRLDSGERDFQDGGREGPSADNLSSHGEDVQEPAGKMLKQEPAEQKRMADAKPPQQQQPAQGNAGRGGGGGRQSGWSKPPSKFPGGNANSNQGFKQSNFNQGGFKRGGSHNQGSSGFNQGGYNQGSGGGYNQGPGDGFNQGTGGGGGGYRQGDMGGGYMQGGGYGQGSDGGYGQGQGGGYGQSDSGTYNTQGGDVHNQGGASYNQGPGSYGQGGAFSQGGGSYAQGAGAFNQGGGYNQSAGGFQQGGGNYGGQNTGYNYGYGSQTPAGSNYQVTQNPAQPLASPQSWSGSGTADQGYWQQQSQGNWQTGTYTAGQMQTPNQGPYNYGWK